MDMQYAIPRGEDDSVTLCCQCRDRLWSHATCHAVDSLCVSWLVLRSAHRLLFFGSWAQADPVEADFERPRCGVVEGFCKIRLLPGLDYPDSDIDSDCCSLHSPQDFAVVFLATVVYDYSSLSEVLPELGNAHGLLSSISAYCKLGILRYREAMSGSMRLAARRLSAC